MKTRMITWGLLICLICLSFSGCVWKRDHSLTPNQIAEQVGNDLMEAIIDKDISAVEALLCPEFQDSHPELDKEIHDMFYLIDGDIVSYDESIYAISGGTTAEGEYVERYVEPGIRNIRTSTGKTYSIYFVYYIVNNDYPQDYYDSEKKRLIDSYEDYPVTKTDFSGISEEERLKIRNEIMRAEWEKNR